jgi:hypothetical protein
MKRKKEVTDKQGIIINIKILHIIYISYKFFYLFRIVLVYLVKEDNLR